MDTAGNFHWARSFGSASHDLGGNEIICDPAGDLFIATTLLDTPNVFIIKMDAQGNQLFDKRLGGQCASYALCSDAEGNIYATGYSSTNNGSVLLVKYAPKNIYGKVFNDFSMNCLQDSNEIHLNGRHLTLQPDNLIASTNEEGYWFFDTLAAGNYSIWADTSDGWLASCSAVQNFVVIHPDSIVEVTSTGLYNSDPCSSPDISVHMPFMRPGFSGQHIYVQACNFNSSSTAMDSAYVILEIDPIISIQSGSLPYTNLGNNIYQVYIGTLNPGNCISFSLGCTLDSTAVLNSTLCIKANLYPADSCVFDDIPAAYTDSSVSPCLLPWDGSSLMVEASCVNDSIRFVIYNTGDPVFDDMQCFAPVRIYIDGQFYLLDSIQLAGGDSIVFIFEGNGSTWRLEADQHPLHPGNSHPNASIENCGSGSWTPDLINSMPHDDADPVVDIFCGLVTGSYDPNDKTGFPLGVGSTNDILPGQQLEYLIRFQNTGTDTAFTVVVRDTLSEDLDIFSVNSGAASHDYSFRMYGPRVLEWTFNNIMLPDSNSNQNASNGFIKFTVEQADNLPLGTLIENSASIYFDFNAPIFTNTYFHTIHENSVLLKTEKIIDEALQVTVYPNPTSGLLFVKHNNIDNLQILLHDNLGRLMLSQESSQQMTQLNLADFLPGIYYLSVNDGKGREIYKVVRR